MDKENREEKEFTRDIELILTGKETRSGEVSDADYRSNIAFAKKVIECGGSPSPSFQQGLKNRLLIKMTEKEAMQAQQRSAAVSFLDWLKNLVPRSPVWRTALATAAIIVLAMVVSWSSGLFSPAREPIVTALPPTVSVEARAFTARTAFAPGETVEIQLSFKNITSETFAFPFPPAIRIENMNVEAVRTFSAGVDNRALAPGETAQYQLTWDQKDDARRQVPPGDYQIVMPNVQLGEGKGVVGLVESPILTISANP
jgi:hypothetical protein